MQITVTLYGRLKADAGTRQLALDVADDATIQTVVDALIVRYPALAAQLDTVAYTIGATLVDPDTAVQTGDEVGLLPPVSGGSGLTHPPSQS